MDDEDKYLDILNTIDIHTSDFTIEPILDRFYLIGKGVALPCESKQQANDLKRKMDLVLNPSPDPNLTLAEWFSEQNDQK